MYVYTFLYSNGKTINAFVDEMWDGPNAIDFIY